MSRKDYINKLSEILNKKINDLNNKLKTVEKEVRNKTKILMANKQSFSMSIKQNNINTSLKSSKGSDDPLAASKRTNDHLKARISNLEKAYEIAKSKLEIAEQTLEKERIDRNKYQENYFNVKSKKTILENENKDMKDKIVELQSQLSQVQQQIKSFEKENTRNTSKQLQRSPDQELKVHDLDDSSENEFCNDDTQDKNNQHTLKSSKENTTKKKTPKKLKSFSKATNDSDLKVVKVSKEETNLFIDINSILLSTLNMTLPILMEHNEEFDEINSSFVSLQSKGILDQSSSKFIDSFNCSPKKVRPQNIIDDEEKQSSLKLPRNIQFGEILYPAFNKLVPRLIEGIYVCNEIADSNKNIQSLLSLTWSCVWFSFDSQLLQKLVDSYSSMSISSIKQKDRDMFDFNLDESKLTEYKKYSPIEIEFPAITIQLKRKLKEMNSKSKN